MIAMEELEVVDGWMLWYPSTVSENVTYTATTHLVLLLCVVTYEPRLTHTTVISTNMALNVSRVCVQAIEYSLNKEYDAMVLLRRCLSFLPLKVVFKCF